MLASRQLMADDTAVKKTKSQSRDVHYTGPILMTNPISNRHIQPNPNRNSCGLHWICGFAEQKVNIHAEYNLKKICLQVMVKNLFPLCLILDPTQPNACVDPTDVHLRPKAIIRIFIITCQFIHINVDHNLLQHSRWTNVAGYAVSVTDRQSNDQARRLTSRPN